jgi:hypothetical protein
MPLFLGCDLEPIDDLHRAASHEHPPVALPGRQLGRAAKLEEALQIVQTHLMELTGA